MKKPPTCHCGSPSELRGGDYVYGPKYVHIKLYVCSRFPECDSYVGVHEGTDKPKGTLADKPLRDLRVVAHTELDALWKGGYMTRSEAYALFNSLTDGKVRHIGETTHQEAQLVIDKIREWKLLNLSSLMRGEAP